MLRKVKLECKRTVRAVFTVSRGCPEQPFYSSVCYDVCLCCASAQPHVYKIREEVYIGHTPLHIMKGVQNRLALTQKFDD